MMKCWSIEESQRSNTPILHYSLYPMNFTTHRFDSVSSTNDVAMQMARDGAADGTVVIAREQTAGKGRHGRSWLSPVGGLYLSAVLRPNIPIDSVWHIGFVVSVAAADAISSVSGNPARVKWPNDVFLNGRKVCGNLVEMGGLGDWGSAGFVVAGIGVDVEPKPFPTEIADKVTSICAETDRVLSAFDVEDALLCALDHRYSEYLTDGFSPILKSWRQMDCTSGRAVEVQTPGGVVKGIAVEVDSDGNLIVETGNGELVRVVVGDVLFGR